MNRRLLSNNSGQTLMIAVALASILLIGATVMFLLSKISAQHQTASSINSKARGVAEEGITYVSQQLSVSSTTWQNALMGNFSGTDCNGSTLTAPSGGLFQLSCSADFVANPGLQGYEVALMATALKSGNSTPLRTIQARLAQRTLGIDLPSGIHSDAAVELVRQPLPTTGNFNVHWGSVVCLDASNATPWTVPDPMDSSQYPRKFSAGGITGGTYSRSGPSYNSQPKTDLKEYWAYLSQINPPRIDETSYQTLASRSDVLTPPKNTSGVPLAPVNCDGLHPNCGYFVPNAGDSAVFDGVGAGYSLPNGTVIYVDGDAQFNKVGIDSATIIVTGALTITDSSGGSMIDLHVPNTAAMEYAYYPGNPATWPCLGQQGLRTGGGIPQYGCHSNQVFSGAGKVQFRGFLCVKGNVYVNVAGFNMVGALYVGNPSVPPGTGGVLSIANGGGLNVAYDDIIAHSILVNPVVGNSIMLVPTQLQDAPTP